jgi:XTP/dITP diphosphohydrolase
MRIVIASKNEHKIAEVERSLGDVGLDVDIVRGLRWPDVEETDKTLTGNALLKARAVVAATGLPAVADDTGLFVDALGGAPGVHSARYAGADASDEENVSKLLHELEGGEDRSARFVTAIAFVTPDGWELTVDGVLEGNIGTQRCGTNGFGYDPVFVVEGRTLAERTAQEKAVMSHRSRALRAFADSLIDFDRVE